MPDRMSKEAEQRLINALGGVARFVNEGTSPDDAIEKVARDADLPPGQVERLVNAYNVGRTIRQREDGQTPAEKAADFTLADYANIFERLYPAVVKTAVETKRATTVSGEYLRPPTWYGRQEDAAVATGVLEKAASALPSRPAAPPGNPEWEARKLVAAEDRFRRDVEEARLPVTSARDRLFAKFAALRDYFKTSGSLALADVRPNIESLYGEAGAAVLDQVVRIDASLEKRAANERVRNHLTFDHPVPYGLVADLLDTSEVLVAATEHAEKRAADYAALKAKQVPLGRNASVFAVLDKEADFRGGMGYGLGLSAFERMGENLTTTKDDLVARTLGKISTPEHEQALHAIEAQSELRNMFNNDEVLSAHDPHEVARHFNRISQFSPMVSRRPLMAVPLVRKSVEQGQLDSFDAASVADTEHKLRGFHAKPTGAKKDEHAVKKGAARVTGSIFARD